MSVGQTAGCGHEGRGAELYLGHEGTRRTVLTGSVIISAVIEQMYWSGTATSLASGGPAASLLPVPLSPPSAVARSTRARLEIE